MLILLFGEGHLVRKGGADHVTPETSLLLTLADGTLLGALVGLPPALFVAERKNRKKNRKNRNSETEKQVE